MAPKNKQESKRLSRSIPALLTDIIIVILLKLPVESLLRCKSVCKHWYSLISDKHFVKTHYSLSSTNFNFANHVFIFPSSQITKLKSCPLNDVLFNNSIKNAMDCFAYPYKSITPFRSSRIEIVGSCNGLLCILFEGNIYIYHPNSARILNRVYCCFEYRDFGFGYDELNDDYKVVALLFDSEKVRIYSLKTGQWKNIFDFPNQYELNLGGIFSNGALHWAEPNSNSGYSSQWKIHSLDLTNEAFDEVLQPKYDEGDTKLELGVLGQSLCVLCNYFKSHADLWVMKVYGVKDSWSKLASIPYYPLKDQFSDYLYDSNLKFSNPLCISNDGKVLLQFGGKCYVFDSKSISFTLVYETCAYEQACTIVESLVPPNSAVGICNRLRSSRKRLRSSHTSS